MESVLANGVLAGFPVLGMKAKLVDGAYHDVDSSVLAFEIAARAACREGLRKAGARLMEPIMQVMYNSPWLEVVDRRNRRSVIPLAPASTREVVSWYLGFCWLAHANGFDQGILSSPGGVGGACR